MSASDERQLILQATAGDRDALRVLIERYMKQAYNIAYCIVRTHDEADDIAQEAFIRVVRSIRSFRAESEFSTWLYRIVVNVALNHRRALGKRNEREIRGVENPVIGSDDCMNECDRIDLNAHIEKALHELPTLQRVVVILRHLNGLSTREV